MQYHAILCNTMQYHAIPCNTMQYHVVLCNTVQYHAIPCNSMQYHAILCNTMQYHAIQRNTMQYHAITCNTMQYPISLNTADGAYHCPVGSIRPFLNKESPHFVKSSDFVLTRGGGVFCSLNFFFKKSEVLEMSYFGRRGRPVETVINSRWGFPLEARYPISIKSSNM